MSLLKELILLYHFIASLNGHDRFYDEEMPGFNEPRNKPIRNKVPRHELVACIATRKVSFPVRGSLSVWAQFHNLPVNLPPLPSANSQERASAEHSYA